MGAHVSNFEQKVQWLMNHPEICKTWPSQPWTDDEVINQMKVDGLVSKGAHNYDLGDLGKPVAEARFRLRKAHNVSS